MNIKDKQKLKKLDIYTHALINTKGNGNLTELTAHYPYSIMVQPLITLASCIPEASVL